jgi:hypothetical protein
MSREVLIIRGAPGTGKSTTAQYLARCFSKGIVIEVDAFRNMINNVSWDSHQHHFDAITAAAAAAKAYLAAGYRPIIFVDTLGFGSLELAVRALEGTSVSVYSVVCNTRDLYVRLWRRVRGYRNVKNAIRFNNHVRTEARDLNTMLDSSKGDARELARRIATLENVPPCIW